MVYIELPYDDQPLLSFFLATEEWIARTKADGEYFLMWQVEPSVIIGRNQDMASEVNLEYCQRHDIKVFRRKSGGGCVYADMSNVMLSYITASDEVQSTFSHYLQLMVGALKSMGIDATWSEHNDIMIGNRKVSGNAFYHLPGRSIVHGTLLYDTNMQNMLHAIIPPREKLSKHGVASVRQRISLLSDHCSLSLDGVKDMLRHTLCHTSYRCTPQDIAEIREIEREYLSDEWINRKINH
jgi:lipoate-protein ligase A